MLSVRPGSCRTSGGYSLANRRLYSCIFHSRKRGLDGLLSAPAGASKRETPTSNLIESTAQPSQHQVISSIFLRKKKNGSYRMILNLKGLNEFIEYKHFKMESLAFE